MVVRAFGAELPDTIHVGAAWLVHTEGMSPPLHGHRAPMNSADVMVGDDSTSVWWKQYETELWP